MEWILTNEEQNQQLKEAERILEKVLKEISYEYDNYGAIRNALELVNRAVKYEQYL